MFSEEKQRWKAELFQKIIVLSLEKLDKRGIFWYIKIKPRDMFVIIDRN